MGLDPFLNEGTLWWACWTRGCMKGAINMCTYTYIYIYIYYTCIHNLLYIHMHMYVRFTIQHAPIHSGSMGGLFKGRPRSGARRRRAPCQVRSARSRTRRFPELRCESRGLAGVRTWARLAVGRVSSGTHSQRETATNTEIPCFWFDGLDKNSHCCFNFRIQRTKVVQSRPSTFWVSCCLGLFGVKVPKGEPFLLQVLQEGEPTQGQAPLVGPASHLLERLTDLSWARLALFCNLRLVPLCELREKRAF